MKVFYVSWNDLETVFHEMPWKKNFTVYPSLYNTHIAQYPNKKIQSDNAIWLVNRI